MIKNEKKTNVSEVTLKAESKFRYNMAFGQLAISLIIYFLLRSKSAL